MPMGKMRKFVPTKKLPVSRRIARLERAVKKNAPEVQQYNQAPISFNPSTAGAVQGIGAAVFGSSSERVGNSVTSKSIHMKNTLELNPLVASTFVRLIIVQYLQDGTPDILDYLQNVAITGPRSIDNRYDFHTLYDKTHQLSTNNPIKSFDIMLKPKKPVNYVPNTLNTIENNGIYSFFLSSEAVNTPTWTYGHISNYVDN